MVKHGQGYRRAVDVEATLGAYRAAYERGDVLAMQRLEQSNPELLEKFATARGDNETRSH